MGVFSALAGSLVSGIGSSIGNKILGGGEPKDIAFSVFPNGQPLRTNFTVLQEDGLYGTTRSYDILGALDDQREQFFQDAMGFNREAFSTRFFDAIDQLASRREAQAFSDAESRLFNRGGVNSGTARQVADFQNDISDARLGRQLLAEQAGFDRFAAMNNQFLQSIQATQGYGNFMANMASASMLPRGGQFGAVQQFNATDAYNRAAVGGRALAASNFGAQLGRLTAQALLNRGAAPVGSIFSGGGFSGGGGGGAGLLSSAALDAPLPHTGY